MADFTALRAARDSLGTRLNTLFTSRLFKGSATVTDKLAAPFQVHSVLEKVRTTTGESGMVTHDYEVNGAVWTSDAAVAVTGLTLNNVPVEQLGMAIGDQLAVNFTLILKQPAVGGLPTTLNVNGNAVAIIWPNNTAPTASAANKTDIVTFNIVVKKTAASAYSYTAYGNVVVYG